MSKHTPKILELKEPPKARILGEFRCTGKGNEPPSIAMVPCGSLLEITTENVYKTTRHSMDFSKEHFSTFTCPVCSCETDFELPNDVSIHKLPEKKDFFSL